jgi:hypothetical protein
MIENEEEEREEIITRQTLNTREFIDVWEYVFEDDNILMFKWACDYRKQQLRQSLDFLLLLRFAIKKRSKIIAGHLTQLIICQI